MNRDDASEILAEARAALDLLERQRRDRELGEAAFRRLPRWRRLLHVIRREWNR